MAKLSPIVSKFATEDDTVAYDVWFRAKVEAALADTRPTVPHDEVVTMLANSRERRRNADRRVV